MKHTKYDRFYRQILPIFGKERIFVDYLRRFAYGLDASCYRYVPKIVVWAKDEQEIQALLYAAKQHSVALTFRAGGTSLSGQACSDSVLVVCAQFWKNISLVFPKNSAESNVLDSMPHNPSKKPTSIWCDCGVIGADANAILKPYGKKIGPDPATINNAMIGGIFSNNSSGMCCGIKQNSYQTVRSVRVVLSDGSILDTSPNAKHGERVEDFLERSPEKWQALQQLRETILGDDTLRAMIAKKFAIKNTTGYALNTLLDFSTPRDVLNHIFVGAEGTLGFVSRVEYECVEDFAHKACALLFYENLAQASKAIEILAANEAIVSAAEIMDYACLKSASTLEGMPPQIAQIKQGNCAILVQLEEDTLHKLESNIAHITKALDSVASLFGNTFSFDTNQIAQWWKIRKALLPLSASMRPSGAIVITEDVCFSIENFALGVEGISDLFARFGYEGIIFGHALSGNVHFIITPLLDDKSQIARFGAFMEALAQMVVELGGSIKAEHGTGRMVAPFVELEWGAKAYVLHRTIKRIFDPNNLINPDVIITEDPHLHLKNLKPAATNLIADYLDACMECGFCEKICPSKNLTLTPRQRIGVYREIARLQALPSLNQQEKQQLQSLQKGYEYLGVETCATCSMCATLCPLEIDTAQIALTKAQERAKNNPFSTMFANFMGKDIARMTHLARTAVRSAKAVQGVVGIDSAFALSKSAHKLLQTPILLPSMPNPAKPLESIESSDKYERKVVFFSSCLNRIFAPNTAHNKDSRMIAKAFESVCKKAGFGIIYPQNLDNLCCGKAYKHHKSIHKHLNNKIYQSLLLASDYGRIPIVCDHSACSLEILSNVRKANMLESSTTESNTTESSLDSGISHKAKDIIKQQDNLAIYDMPAFLAKFCLPYLRFTPLGKKIALYAPCATRNLAVKNLGWEEAFSTLAKALGAEVCVDSKIACCGFAGNKGFSTPELNASALECFGIDSLGTNLFSDVMCGVSSSSTCEIGLEAKSGFAWQHIVYLVDKCASSVDV